MARRSATRPDAIRQHNLHVLLVELHHHGAMSRTALTVRLGLNRSTIGALVADLTESGLVVERVPVTRIGAGRPSHVVGPRDDGPYVLAIDIDVRRLVVAAIGLGGGVLARRTVELAERDVSPQYVVNEIVRMRAELAGELDGGAWPVGIGVSVPGTVRRIDGQVLVAPNLGWRDVDLDFLIRAGLSTELPIHVGNDADLGALAEHLRGAARGIDDVLFINARIGVGGGVIADGAPLRGAVGLAGEIGHMVVDPAGPDCHCGNRGCFETFVGERALVRRSGLNDLAGVDGTTAVLRAAAAGDPRAIAAVEHVTRWLGRGLASLASILNPAVIVIGGSLTPLAEAYHDQIRASFDENMRAVPPESVEIRSPGLGPDSTLLGAAEIGFTDLLAAPVDTALAYGPLPASG